MVLKIKEIKEMGKEELNSRLKELKKELIKVNAQRATKASMKNPEQLKEIKRTIARILTIKKKQEGIKKYG